MGAGRDGEWAGGGPERGAREVRGGAGRREGEARGGGRGRRGAGAAAGRGLDSASAPRPAGPTGTRRLPRRRTCAQAARPPLLPGRYRARPSTPPRRRPRPAGLGTLDRDLLHDFRMLVGELLLVRTRHTKVPTAPDAPSGPAADALWPLEDDAPLPSQPRALGLRRPLRPPPRRPPLAPDPAGRAGDPPPPGPPLRRWPRPRPLGEETPWASREGG